MRHRHGVNPLALGMRVARAAADLSANELARRAGIDRATVVRLENARFVPSGDTLRKLAKVLALPAPRRRDA